MHKYIFIVFSFLLINVSMAQVAGKRAAPKVVKPVIFNKIKFTAPTNKIGYIIAKNVETDSILWEKQIYKVKYNKDLEEDVQDDFIDSLRIQGEYLIIRTEKNKIFSLKLK